MPFTGWLEPVGPLSGLAEAIKGGLQGFEQGQRMVLRQQQAGREKKRLLLEELREKQRRKEIKQLMDLRASGDKRAAAALEHKIRMDDQRADRADRAEGRADRAEGRAEETLGMDRQILESNLESARYSRDLASQRLDLDRNAQSFGQDATSQRLESARNAQVFSEDIATQGLEMTRNDMASRENARSFRRGVEGQKLDLALRQGGLNERQIEQGMRIASESHERKKKAAKQEMELRSQQGIIQLNEEKRNKERAKLEKTQQKQLIDKNQMSFFRQTGTKVLKNYPPHLVLGLMNTHKISEEEAKEVMKNAITSLEEEKKRVTRGRMEEVIFRDSGSRKITEDFPTFLDRMIGKEESALPVKKEESALPIENLVPLSVRSPEEEQQEARQFTARLKGELTEAKRLLSDQTSLWNEMKRFKTAKRQAEFREAHRGRMWTQDPSTKGSEGWHMRNYIKERQKFLGTTKKKQAVSDLQTNSLSLALTQKGTDTQAYKDFIRPRTTAEWDLYEKQQDALEAAQKRNMEQQLRRLKEYKAAQREKKAVANLTVDQVKAMRATEGRLTEFVAMEKIRAAIRGTKGFELSDFRTVSSALRDIEKEDGKTILTTNMKAAITILKAKRGVQFIIGGKKYIPENLKEVWELVWQGGTPSPPTKGPSK